MRGNGDMRGLTVSALQANFVLWGLSAAGADAEAVRARAGLSAEDLGDPQKRLPKSIIVGLWRAAEELTGDPVFGLHVAERFQPGMFDVVEYIARSSHTLGEAARRAQRYVRLFDDVAELRVLETEDEITLVPRLTHGERMPDGVAECVLSTILIFARQTTGLALVPVRVEMRRPEPADTREHLRVFGVLPRFLAAENALTCTREQFASPLKSADPALSAILDRHAEALLERVPKVDGLRERVRSKLATALRGGDPSAEAIAAELGMSARTLRRKLDEQGSSFQSLMDGVRSELALRYLEEGRLGLADIAFELGFADERAFRRAFKRWTGRTPRASG